MSSFKVIERQSPCQSIREYPQCTSTSQEEVLYLRAKQYIPLNRTPKDGDVTILACHASAFPKELYEPLWEDLLKASEKAGYGIRSIWMADVANQGASYVLNESKTGNDRRLLLFLKTHLAKMLTRATTTANFSDHARDLLCLINTYRTEFTRPIVGMGHSMGASSIAFLSQMHPRLLSSLVLLDAVIPYKALDSLFAMARLPSFRKDLWPSRHAAESAFRKNALVKTFDPRVVDKILEFSIRPTPTLLHPNAPEGSYTLTTPKHQEAFSIARPNYADVAISQSPSPEERATHPDIWPCAPYKSPFYKSEGRTCWMFLPYLRPAVFWLYGSESYAADPEERAEKMRRTGTGWNGSGGAGAGRVKEGFVEGSGHFLCFDRVAETADKVSEWLDAEVGVWMELEEKSVDDEWVRRDVVGRQVLDKRWLDEVKVWKGQKPVPASKL